MPVDLFGELTALAAAFDAAGVDYALCGAIALAIHGAPRATKDIDILARVQDLPRIRDVARGCGFTIEGLPMTFSATGVSIHRLAGEGRTWMLDVLIVDGPLDAVWSTRMRVQLAMPNEQPRELSVVSRDGLISLKLAAARPQDLVDIQKLQEVSRGES